MDTKKATNKQTTAAIASARQIPPIKRIFLITSRLSPSDRQLFSSHRPWVETRSLPTLTRSSPRRFTFYVADPSAPFTGLHRFDYIGFRRREQDEVHGAPLSLQIGCDLTHSIPLYSGPPQAGLTYDQSLAPFPAAPSANLSLGRMRRQKNHQSKLQSADGQWKNDGGIKERKHARDQSIVNLQETDCCAQNAKHIEKITVSPHILDYRRP